jgi:hypothetical protein
MEESEAPLSSQVGAKVAPVRLMKVAMSQQVMASGRIETPDHMDVPVLCNSHKSCKNAEVAK